LVTAASNFSTKLVTRVGLSLAMKPAISSKEAIAALVHLINMNQSAVLGKHRFDLLIGCKFACIGLLDAFVNVTNLPGFTLQIVGFQKPNTKQSDLAPEKRTP
jgi:hypothetical protein